MNVDLLISSIIARSSEYMILGLAFAALFSVTKAFNLVLGASFSCGAIAALVVGYFGPLPRGIGIALALVIAGSVGSIFMVSSELLFTRRLREKRADPLLVLLATFAIYMILENTALVLTRSQILYFGWIPVEPAKEFLSLSLTVMQITGLVVAGVVLLAWTRIRRTLAGLQVRLAECDYTLAIIAGVRANRIVVLLSAIAGAIMGVDGFLQGAQTGVEASMGLKALFPAIVVGMVAIKPSPLRLIAAAAALATAETIAVVTLGQQWQSSTSYLALVLALLFRRVALSTDRSRSREWSMFTTY